MRESFDGAGRGPREPTYRAVLTLLAAILVVITLSWLGVSWAMNNGVTPPADGSPQVEQP